MDYVLEYFYSRLYIRPVGMFQRSLVATIVGRLAERPNRIVAVFGPRQTGKTTIVRQALQQIEKDSLYLSVDELQQPGLPSPSGPESAETAPRLPQVRDVEWLVRNWEEARHRADQPGQGFVLVLDEIQKIRGWSSVVKGLWDADRARGRPLHVVLLWSAPLLAQSGLSETLAGRFEIVRVDHWSFPEMSSAFGLTLPEYLYFGGYPGAAEYIRDPDRWREYVLHALVEPNIERDIFDITRVDKPTLLKRLFELGAAPSRCGQHDHAGPLPQTALGRGPADRATETHRPAHPAQGVEPEAHRPQHRAHDRRVGILLRPSPNGPYVLGSTG